MAKEKTIRLTMAQALVEHLAAQQLEDSSGAIRPLCAGVFAIFGHGNVTCLGEALYANRKQLPVWRGQNEQAMGLACAGYARAVRRQGFMAASSSIGPGATNMVTAAAVCSANRLPALFLSGDTFANRLPDPVLQQIERPGDPSTTANDAFRPVVHYWDRIVHPAQLIASLPQMYAMLLDPGACGPAFLALPQDVQEMSYKYPVSFFEPVVHRIKRARPDAVVLKQAAAALKAASKPLIVAGGGVHFSHATNELAAFASKRQIPVVETLAGRSSLADDHEMYRGPVGVTGSSSANEIAPQADVVVALGTRLQDFTTSSGTVFWKPDVELISINAARLDAVKRDAIPVVGDARETLKELDATLGRYKAKPSWVDSSSRSWRRWNRYLKQTCSPKASAKTTYGQVMGAVNRLARKGDVTVSAAGGLPGEHNKIWQSRQPGDFDCEFGFSCMGYEIAGAYGFKMGTQAKGEVITLCGDGSYLMMNSDVLSTVMTGHKLIIVLCDNGGYAVINRLQVGKGSAEFNNLFRHCKGREVKADFVAHAKSMGADGEWVKKLSDFDEAFARARKSKQTYIIGIKVAQYQWTGGDAWWDVGVPEVSKRASVQKAYADQAKGRRARLGGR